MPTAIVGYAWATPTYSPASVVIASKTGTFQLTVANSIVRDSTPPACALTSIVPGPPTLLKVTTSDASSGLKSIVVTKLINATVNIPVFAQGSTAPVLVTATKVNQSLTAELALRVTDIAGNVTDCDPYVLTVTGPVIAQTLTGVAPADHILTIINGPTGLTSLSAYVNGKLFVMTKLKAGETRTIDIASGLTASSNTVVLVGVGTAKATATILLWDGVGTP